MWWSGSAFVTWAAAALLAMVAVAAPDSPAEDAPGGQVLLLRTSQVDAGPGVELVGSTLRVGDRAVAFPGVVREAVATAGGLYALVGDELWVTDLEATLRTGITGARDLVVSADGRYLGFRDGTTVTVYDTRSGERLVHSRHGLAWVGRFGLGELRDRAAQETR